MPTKTQSTQAQGLMHPYDTAIVVRELCRTHAELRRMRFQNAGKTHQMSAIPAQSPILETLTVLEDEIERLMELLPWDHQRNLAASIASTHAPQLQKLIPQGNDKPPYRADTEHVLFTIASGIEALRIESDMGMYPSLEDLNSTFVALMDKCDRPEAQDWRNETKRLLLRQPNHLCTSLLWYVRDRRERGDPISSILSVFLAELLQDYARKYPEEAQMACRGAAIGSTTHDVAALFLAGVTLPAEDTSVKQGGPKVNALLDACASQHGRIAFIKRFGPLEAYFEKGEVPDYREART